MKKNFKLEGLDCANCAAKIERAINKIEGIEQATVNFMTTKLSFETSEEKVDGLIKEIELVVKKLSPSVVLKKV